MSKSTIANHNEEQQTKIVFMKPVIVWQMAMRTKREKKISFIRRKKKTIEKRIEEIYHVTNHEFKL